MADLAGIVLAGGAARRLSGVDKPMLEIGGQSLLHRAVTALSAADPVVVVGRPRVGIQGVRWTREHPAGAGPVAALAAGLRVVPASPTRLVAVLAGDLAAITACTVARLARAVGERDGAVLVDAAGHRQWLIGVWHADTLRGALSSQPTGASLRGVLGGLTLTEVAAAPGESEDVDTLDDLDRLR